VVILVCIGPCTQVQGHAKVEIPNVHDILAGTIGALEAEGMLHAEQVDKTKIWIEQKASQKLSNRRSRQIYFVEVVLLDGTKIDAFAVRDNSPIVEQSGLVVYVVSKVLQPDGKPVPARQ